MSLDITPRAAPGQPLINAYGDGGFRINGMRHEGSVIIADGVVVPWSAPAPGAIEAGALAGALAAGRPGAILIIGCGPRFIPPPPGLREKIRESGPVLEWMDTSAACRTFNVLLIEGRDVAAALIAVS